MRAHVIQETLGGTNWKTWEKGGELNLRLGGKSCLVRPFSIKTSPAIMDEGEKKFKSALLRGLKPRGMSRSVWPGRTYAV